MKVVVVILVVFVVLGLLFVSLAKKYKQNKFRFFIIGSFSFLITIIVYGLIYGYLVDFKINDSFKFHRRISLFIGFFLSILIYYLIKLKLEHKFKAE